MSNKVPMFQKKPIALFAYQLPVRGEDLPDSFHEWAELVGFENFTSERDQTLVIKNADCDIVACPSDWIVKGQDGEFFAITPSGFETHFERFAPSREQLENELERLRMQLAACGVVALANTRDSAESARKMHPDYRSASLDDVCRAVDSEMDLREQLAVAGLSLPEGWAPAPGVETDIDKRWEAGTDHHPKSKQAFDAIRYLDEKFCGDSFCFKAGGDGDNGETLMYGLDIFFESQDAVLAQKASQ